LSHGLEVGGGVGERFLWSVRKELSEPAAKLHSADRALRGDRPGFPADSVEVDVREQLRER
jgi:hypothetical protein